MKLLIITQKIDQNDSILGFFHKWVEEFAKQAERVVVLAQFVGKYDLPQNVEVFSLGKEKGYSKIRQVFNFYALLFKNLPKIDAVFVHMIPMWVVLGCPFYKIYRKKVYLWYMHKSVKFWLKIAGKCVKKIFTASIESCRLKSDKIVITGHGIDVEKFKGPKEDGKNSGLKIITSGRITPIKNLDLLVVVAEILKNKGINFEINIEGKPILETDKTYFIKLQSAIKEKRLEDTINFLGAMPYKNVDEFYRSGDIFVNFSDTGSMDKAVLGAMASGVLVLTSNEAFKNILAEKYFTEKNPAEIAEKILALSKVAPDKNLRDYVVKNHSLNNTISRILANME